MTSTCSEMRVSAAETMRARYHGASTLGGALPSTPVDPHDPSPKDEGSTPLKGCLLVWLSLLSGVAGVVAACFGRGWLAGGALLLALALWRLKGRPDPRLYAEFAARYGVDDDPDQRA